MQDTRGGFSEYRKIKKNKNAFNVREFVIH